MKKLGTFNGVFIPSFEAILGAVLFLLLPHLVGEIGLINILVIIIISNLITTATAFSIGDCTSAVNTIGAGGMYAVSKRSLGKAFGGSIGIQLFMAQAASIGFYAMGFATPLQEILLNIPVIHDFVAELGISILIQKQIIASVLALAGLTAALVGADFVIKIQFVIFIILSFAIAGFFSSPLIGLSFQNKPLFSETINLWGAGSSYAFFVALTTFFPAVTGIDAGVGMSGLLKNPRRSLFRGTFAAIGITFLLYTGLSILFSYMNPALLLMTDQGLIPSTTALFTGSTILYILLMTGVMVATGSSALSYFVTAPRTLQALTEDGILPRFMDILGKDFKKGGNEPRVATLLTWILCMLVVWSGDVNVSSRVVGIAFLVVYGWINLVAFFERVSGNPSFRPERKVPWMVGLAGFLGAMAVIVLDDALIGIILIACQFLIFNLILRYKAQGQLEGVWWGLLFSIINWGIHRLDRIIQGTKNWRPMLTVFVYGDKMATALPTLNLARRIGEFKGMVAVNILPGKGIPEGQRHLIPAEAKILEDDRADQTEIIPLIAQTALPSGLSFNSVLVAADNRLNLANMIERLILQERNVLIYKDGIHTEAKPGRIDLWWKGEENGNLMALLAYIIVQSDEKSGQKATEVRIVRKLEPGQNKAAAEQEMRALMERNHISASIELLEDDSKSFLESLQTTSGDASLVFLGMPGEPASNLAKMFKLDKLFFDRELDKYTDLPPILFVKAASVMQLMDD